MEKEELEILEYVFQLATGECYSCEIAEIGKLEEKIGTILYQYKKQKEIINNAINFINTPWSFESGNKKVDEIIHQKKIELIKLLKDKEV